MTEARQLVKAVVEGESAREWLRRHKNDRLRGWKLEHVENDSGGPWHFRRGEKLFTLCKISGGRKPWYRVRVLYPALNRWIDRSYWRSSTLEHAQSEAVDEAERFYSQFEK